MENNANLKTTTICQFLVWFFNKDENILHCCWIFRNFRLFVYVFSIFCLWFRRIFCSIHTQHCTLSQRYLESLNKNRDCHGWSRFHVTRNSGFWVRFMHRLLIHWRWEKEIQSYSSGTTFESRLRKIFVRQ